MGYINCENPIGNIQEYCKPNTNTQYNCSCLMTCISRSWSFQRFRFRFHCIRFCFHFQPNFENASASASAAKVLLPLLFRFHITTYKKMITMCQKVEDFDPDNGVMLILNELHDKVRELFLKCFYLLYSFHVPNCYIRLIYHTTIYLGCRDKLAFSILSFCTLPFLCHVTILPKFLRTHGLSDLRTHPFINMGEC